jgi:SulP family sulfate permease
MLSLVPDALAIAVVAFAGNWAVAKKYSLERGERGYRGYEVDATQELIAQGLSTIVGSFFNSFVPSGGLSRSAVNAESGAQTQVGVSQ